MAWQDRLTRRLFQLCLLQECQRQPVRQHKDGALWRPVYQKVLVPPFTPVMISNIRRLNMSSEQMSHEPKLRGRCGEGRAGDQKEGPAP
jgi:hypothetical protein